MADDTEGHAGEGPELKAEMRAINERLVIAAVRQQELAEAATRSAETAWKSGELYRLLARNFPDGMVFLFDRDLRCLLAEGRGLTVLGFSREKIEGKTLREWFPPQACRQIEPASRAALAGGTTVLDVRLHPARAARDRPERTYQVHALPVRDDAGNIRAGMAMAQDVTERRRAEDVIRWRAYHDVLTGLPNRALLRDRLDRVLAMAERSGELAALLFLDLDRFKHVNDTLGHVAGDRLLVAVAVRLTGCLRAEDTVARLGGDEFVVLLPSLRAAGDAADVARKILAVLSAPLLVEGHEMSVTASVGMSLFPLDGHDAATLMETADAAMYRSKQARRVEEGP